jgi:hypothetical protein
LNLIINERKINMSGIPLYLQNSKVQKLDIDSTQRLRIERSDLPEKRIPIHLVSRIVCRVSLDISARALVACMKKGIPLALVDNDGQAIGWCMGARRTETTMRQLLIHALDDYQWNEYYSQWLLNQRQANAAQSLLLCSVPATSQARYNPRAALCNAHRQKHKQACGNFVNALTYLAQHELSAHLNQETGAPELLVWARPGLNIIHDLGGLLSFHAHTDVHHAHLLLLKDLDKQATSAWATRHYEKHIAHWQQRIAQISWSFEQFLRNHWL